MVEQAIVRVVVIHLNLVVVKYIIEAKEELRISLIATILQTLVIAVYIDSHGRIKVRL